MPKNNVKILVAIGLLVVFGGLATLMKPPIGYNQGYQPKQPIPYDHQLHAGKHNIPCQYCHAGVDRSLHAAVPSLNICMNCHNQVKSTSELITKIREHHDAGKAIQWVNVHMLPDFVHFNHQMIRFTLQLP